MSSPPSIISIVTPDGMKSDKIGVGTNRPKSVIEASCSIYPTKLKQDGLYTMHQYGQYQQKKSAITQPVKTTEISKPKRPLTAYNIFFRSERSRIMEEEIKANGGVKPSGAKKRNRRGKNKDKDGNEVCFSAMAKVIGQKWKSLNVSEKAVFEAEAAKDLRRYRSDMERYRQTLHVIGGRHYQVLSATSAYAKLQTLPMPHMTLSSTGMGKNTAKGPPPMPVVSSCEEVVKKALNICDVDPLSSCVRNLESDLRSTLGDDTIDILCDLESDPIKPPKNDVTKDTAPEQVAKASTCKECKDTPMEAGDAMKTIAQEMDAAFNEGVRDIIFDMKSLSDDRVMDPLEFFASFEDDIWDQMVGNKKRKH